MRRVGGRVAELRSGDDDLAHAAFAHAEDALLERRDHRAAAHFEAQERLPLLDTIK